jgi:hypothetical protein
MWCGKRKKSKDKEENSILADPELKYKGAETARAQA